MSTSKKLATAALTGLLAVGIMGAGIAQAHSIDKIEKSSAAEKEKHACKGQNSCKGKGGCATDGSKA